MSECEDFFLEYWISPGKRKRKKNPKENKMWVKHKNTITVKTDESLQKKKKKKKKKNSKFKEAVEERKEKKKERKKKKSSQALDDSFISTQGYSGASDPVVKPKASYPHSTDHLTQESKKKTKRKKKVAFDLSPGYICVKRPKFVSSSPKENILPEKAAVTDNSCSQVTKTQPSQAQSHDSDSQCTSDDINSQDLFITQKIFRTFPPEPSSGEASDKAVDTPPQQTITQQEMMQHSPVVQIQHDEGSNTHLQESHFHQHPKKVKEPLLKEKAALIVLTEEEEEKEEGDFDLAQQNPRKQFELDTNLTEEKKVYGAVRVEPRAVNRYLDDPTVVKCSMDVIKSCTSSQESPSCLPNTNRPSLPLQTSTASISTQTENFFTAELSSYLSFRHRSGASSHFETLKPLDLSLPQRVRKDLERRLSVKNEVKVDKEKLSEQKATSLPEDTKGHKDPSLQSSSSSERKDGELKTKDPAVRQLWCVSTRCKGQSAPSPQSESELKSADTTSSEDNEPAWRTSKLDLTQVRAYDPLKFYSLHQKADKILQKSALVNNTNATLKKNN